MGMSAFKKAHIHQLLTVIKGIDMKKAILNLNHTECKKERKNSSEMRGKQLNKKAFHLNFMATIGRYICNKQIIPQYFILYLQILKKHN